MLKIGLTGGIATGKAAVADCCARLGALVIDADDLAHEALAPGGEAWRKAVDAFGRGILTPEGAIDRRALARLVFADTGKREQLNMIVHPPVIAGITRRLSFAEAEGKHPAAVVNVPLLFEAGMAEMFDAVVVVTCPREEQVRRCAARDGLSVEEVEARIGAQMPLDEKERRADYVIDNGGTREETETQVEGLWKTLTGGSR
ncbi:MAG: dephospho-CoA kinase [Candidatus Aureabacteria bacterium]|nr:dephospho-CoA kinase [Candidatus Auribacterota bacterium]